MLGAAQDGDSEMINIYYETIDEGAYWIEIEIDGKIHKVKNSIGSYTKVSKIVESLEDILDLTAMNKRDKIIAEIAADEKPLYFNAAVEESECRYCLIRVYLEGRHAKDCIWVRSRVLLGEEPGRNAIVIAEGVLWERD